MRPSARLLAGIQGILAVLVLATIQPASAQGVEIGFEEKFALAPDRAEVLDELIPGTRDYYFYHCLHSQHVGNYAEVDRLLALWIERHGRGGRVQQIENRQALLKFGMDAESTYDFLKRRLGLRFDAQQRERGREQRRPTTLDPAEISRETLTRRALQRHPGTVNGFHESAFEYLAASDLSDDLLQSLLSRVVRPDLANLPALIARELDNKRSRGFGSLRVHRSLTIDQLEELLQLRPKLIEDTNFVAVYLPRLRPNDDVDWEVEEAARAAYLDRLYAFAQRLPASQNSLKAHVLYHRLRHDLRQGVVDKERFLAYLRLPRQVGYANKEYVRRHRRETMVDLGQGFASGLSEVGDDEALVRACFAQLFESETSYQPYARFVDSDYLRRLFAETKILAGVGDMEQWYSLLDDASYYERLKERVTIESPPTQPRYYGFDDPVSIEVDVKNVETLLVKVFEIDTFDYQRDHGRDVDASIDLDGMVAGVEQTHEYDDSPLRRVRRKFDFPMLQDPGTYIVEFIGNGLSSRAVIRKGRLQALERVGAAGHVFRVLDAEGEDRPSATLWFAGREYQPDDEGEIHLPFASKPGRKPVVLRDGAVSSIEWFHHDAERYDLHAGIFVDRESLLAGRRTQVVVRPTLRVGPEAVSLELLEDAYLTIVARDLDGVASSQTVRDLELSMDGEFVHEIRVPTRLSQLTVELHAKVRNVSASQDESLSAGPAWFHVNHIDATERTASPLLGRDGERYVVDVLGKNGEPRPRHPVQVQLEHRDFTDPIHVALETDDTGRIDLGPLAGITKVTIPDAGGDLETWHVRMDARTMPATLFGIAGRSIRIPYDGDSVSFFERRGSEYFRDRAELASVDGGFVTLRDVPAGNFELYLPAIDRTVTVQVTDGKPQHGWAIGRARMLELRGHAALQIRELRSSGDTVEIALANAGPSTRVHVFASRYLPAFHPFMYLSGPAARQPRSDSIEHPDSTYHAGREIGDEYRYILDRRFAAKYPGNLLTRPGLLLNPWALDEAQTAIGLGGGAGGRHGGRSGGRSESSAGPSTPGPVMNPVGPGTFANLDFLPNGSQMLANLRPDANGNVSVKLTDLGDGRHVHVVAVDAADTVYRSLALPMLDLEPRSLALVNGLDPAGHFAERREIDFVKAGDRLVIDDVTATTFQSFESLADVFQLFQTMTENGDLTQFSFVLEWPELTAERKQELYSEHACHELNLFLHEKDAAFFDAVVRPFLANKMHKTFLDEWLLDADLTPYLDPWQFKQLNIVERILLTKRVAGRSAAGARHVRELLEMIPRDDVAIGEMFKVALKTTALDSTQAGALGSADRVPELGRARVAPTKPAGERPNRSLADEDAEELEEEGKDAGDKQGDDFFMGTGIVAERERRSNDLKARKQVRQLYRAPATTRRYVEHNYWHRTIEATDAQMIPVNPFWNDFALVGPDDDFVSKHIAHATSSFAEMMLALAMLDLPFAVDDDDALDGNRLTKAGPLLVVRKEVQSVDPAEDVTPILISQNFYRLDDRFHFVGNERHDKFVTDEFLIGVAYGCQVVLTNPTSTRRRLELLTQIPRGATPVNNGFYTRGRTIQLEPFATQTFEFAFYFPQPGEFAQFPAHVASDGKLVAFAEAETFEVLVSPRTIDTTSWEHVSQSGTTDEVYDYLDRANLNRIDLSKIGWRLRDRAVYERVVQLLRDRHAYHHGVWSHGVYHRDTAVAREFLSNEPRIVNRCGAAIASELLTIDPVERKRFQLVEFRPLFNARAHQFGKRREVLNHELGAQYHALMAVLSYLPRLEDEHWMTVAYYMLLQDRVTEALDAFGRVRADRLATGIQYDYMKAYLDFYRDQPRAAREIAERYRDYPVAHWRSVFREVLAQLDELDGADAAITDGDDPSQQQAALAASEPSLDVAVEARRVSLKHANLSACEVNYYEMDVEFSFSTSPFVKHGAGSFAYIKPNRSDAVVLAANRPETSFDLPSEFRNSNVLVEVSSAGLTRRQTYFANSLNVQTSDAYGQLRVTHASDGRPLPKVYVKVYKRTGTGEVRFHKDGYTDLRGKFDYASVSGDTEGAERFAILVLSEKHGALTREVAPPAQ